MWLARARRYVLAFAVGIVALLYVRGRIASDAVDAFKTELDRDDQERAAEISRAASAAQSGRLRRPNDGRGYRD